MTSVCVIGSGIAGLSAATRLQRAGYDVTVFERASFVGGRAATRQRDGVSYNTGASIYYDYSHSVRTIIAENGLEGRSQLLPRLQVRCSDGREAWSLDMTPTPRFIGNKDFSIIEKIRAGNLLLSLIARGRHFMGDDACSAVALDAELLSDFCFRKLGRELTAKLIGVVYRSARGMNLADLSPTTFVSMMKALIFNQKVKTMDGGIGIIAEKMAAALSVRTNVQVTDVAETHDCCDVQFVSGREVERQSFDLVVVAVEGTIAGNIVSTTTDAERAFFRRVKYNSAIYVHFLLNQKIDNGYQFLANPDCQWISAVKISSVKGTKGITNHLVATVTPEIIQTLGSDIDEDAVIKNCVRELEKNVLKNELNFVSSFVQFIRNKTPIFGPGYTQAALNFRNGQAVGRRRVFYCGDYLYQPLLGGAALSGLNIAEHIIHKS